MTKGIGNKSRRKMALVISRAKGIMTPQSVSKLLNVSAQEGGRLLSRWSHSGWAKRIKQGVYIPIPADDLTGEATAEDSWVLADRLFSPGYIGGFSAVKHWDFSEQIFETTTFFTTKKVNDRHPTIGNTRFQLKTITPYKIFGTQPVWRESSKVLVSDPTKTIVDLFDNPTVVGGMRVVRDIFLEYRKSNYFDVEKIIVYSSQMKNKTILKRFGFLMESEGLYDLIKNYDLPAQISKGYSLFDPSVKNTSVMRKWNLKVPEAWKNKK